MGRAGQGGATEAADAGGSPAQTWHTSFLFSCELHLPFVGLADQIRKVIGMPVPDALKGTYIKVTVP